jgi:O-antigen/teichoic acid export membrane protein
MQCLYFVQKHTILHAHTDGVRISKSFIKSSLTYTIAGTLPMASAIILLPFYIAHLSTSDFGALSVYFAFALFIQVLTTFSFDTSVYIHFHELKSNKPALASFVSSAFVLMTGIGAGIALIFVLSGDFIFSKIFTDKAIGFFPYGLLTAGTGIFQALFKVHGSLLQSREKPEVFFWSNIVLFSLIVIFTIGGLKVFPGTLAGPVGGRLIASLLAATWAMTRVFREFGFHLKFGVLKDSFAFNFYTFLYQLLQWVINYFDRIIMVFYLSLSQVGVYDFAMKCLLVIEFVLNGLHNTFYPRVVSTVMAQEVKSSSPEINRYYHGFISVIMLMICLCVLTFPWLVETFVNKPEYQDSTQYMPYIAAIYIFRCIRLFFAAPYGILKFTKPMPVMYLVVSSVKIGVTVVLIQKFAVYGVIAASLMAAITEIFLLRFNIQSRFTFRYNHFKIIIAPVTLFLVIIVLEPLLGHVAPFILHLFYTLCCVVLLTWVYRNEVRLLNPFKLIR